MKKIIVMSILALSIMLSGCVSRFFSVGEEESYCQEMGCNYKDVGVCANPMEILENKDDLSDIKSRNDERRKANAKHWWN